MKHLKLKVLAIAGLMFGLGLVGVFSEPAAAKTTRLSYTIWISGANMSQTMYANVDGDVAKVSCRNTGGGLVQVETNTSINPQLLSGLWCGEKKQELDYTGGHQSTITYYANVRDIENQLKKNGVGIYEQEVSLDFDNWNGDHAVYGIKDSKATVQCVHVPTSEASDYLKIVTQVAGNGSTESYTISIPEECNTEEVKTKLRGGGFLVGNWKTSGDWSGEVEEPKKDDDDPKDGDDDPKDDNDDDDPNNGGGKNKSDDPVTPMTYGEVDDQASILVGCSRAEKKQLPSGEWVDDETKKGEGIKCIINLVIDIMTVGVGILSVVGITVVGVQYLSAGGSEEKTRKAKRRMLEIVIGVALYVVAYAALKWLLPNFG